MRTFAQKPKATQQTKPAESSKANPTLSGQRRDMHSMLQLQRTIGNQAVQRLLRTDSESLEVEPSTTAATRFANNFSRIPVYATTPVRIQPKLMVNAPGAIYEQEADRAAAQVMRMTEDIVFRQGKYQPATLEGRRRLAHVVQQHGGNVVGTVQRQQAPGGPVCPVTPIPPITDADALAMEGGTRVIWNNTAAGLQAAANNLVGLIQAAGGTATITSAYRPQAYQDHLRAVWDRARALQNQPQPGPCDAVRATVNAEMANHQLNVNRPVAQTSNHTGGNAVDI